MAARKFDLLARLQAAADPKHAAFIRKLIPGVSLPLLGLRMPLLHRIAKDLARQDDWRDYIDNYPAAQCMEESMLRGLLLGQLSERSCPIELRLKLIEKTLPSLDNWSLIDSCVTCYKFARKHPERVWEWLEPMLISHQEYQARFGVVMLLWHYCDKPEYAQRIATALPLVPSGAYYCDMAVAWCSCELCIRQPVWGKYLIHESRLASKTRAMALRKIRESYRISDI